MDAIKQQKKLCRSSRNSSFVEKLVLQTKSAPACCGSHYGTVLVMRFFGLLTTVQFSACPHNKAIPVRLDLSSSSPPSSFTSSAKPVLCLKNLSKLQLWVSNVYSGVVGSLAGWLADLEEEDEI
ncbi:unnamed protein product [Calypogeia fissa]